MNHAFEGGETNQAGTLSHSKLLRDHAIEYVKHNALYQNHTKLDWQVLYVKNRAELLI